MNKEKHKIDLRHAPRYILAGALLLTPLLLTWLVFELQLKTVAQLRTFLNGTPAVSFTQLDTIANMFSDNEAAQRLNAARNILFQSINRRSKQAA